MAAECRAAATLQLSTSDLAALAADLDRMHESLNRMATTNAQWRGAGLFAQQLRALVAKIQAWLASQLSSKALPFVKASCGPIYT